MLSKQIFHQLSLGDVICHKYLQSHTTHLPAKFTVVNVAKDKVRVMNGRTRLTFLTITENDREEWDCNVKTAETVFSI